MHRGSQPAASYFSMHRGSQLQHSAVTSPQINRSARGGQKIFRAVATTDTDPDFFCLQHSAVSQKTIFVPLSNATVKTKKTRKWVHFGSFVGSKFAKFHNFIQNKTLEFLTFPKQKCKGELKKNHLHVIN